LVRWFKGFFWLRAQRHYRAVFCVFYFMVSREEMNHEGAKSAKEGGFRERYSK
jgi:hypothetical protein